MTLSYKQVQEILDLNHLWQIYETEGGPYLSTAHLTVLPYENSKILLDANKSFFRYHFSVYLAVFDENNKYIGYDKVCTLPAGFGNKPFEMPSEYSEIYGIILKSLSEIEIKAVELKTLQQKTVEEDKIKREQILKAIKK